MRIISKQIPWAGKWVTPKMSEDGLERLKGHIKAALGSAVILALGFAMVFVMKATLVS